MSQVNAVRNPDDIFVNTQTFREEALHFLKYGYYCPDPWGSPAWKDYWGEQLNRCKNGYSSGGAYVTGNHYGYLNFAQIKITPEFKKLQQEAGLEMIVAEKDPVKKRILQKKLSGVSAEKEVTFPSFWSMDYNYFHVLDIARWGADLKYIESLGLEVIILPDALNGGWHVIIGKSRRKGYEQPHSEIIMTPNGHTTMGDIKIGDKVCTPDGKIANVVDKFPQGVKNVYEVKLFDGRKVRCGLDHLWEIITYKGETKIVDTKFLLEHTLVVNENKPNQYYQFYIKNTQPVQYAKKELPIDPYLLGILLGDGSLTQKTVLFSSNDKFIVDEIRKIVGDKLVSTKAKYQYRINGKGRRNILYQELEKLKLTTGALNKFIPEKYKYVSYKQRLALVQGLMDSDGTSSPNGTARFTSGSESLINDLAFILRGLGIRVKKALVKKDGNPNNFSNKDYWILSIVTNKKIFRLPRKLKNIRTDRKYDFNKSGIVSIKKLNYQEESSCILIDSDEHLYLTTNYVVTHNSYKNGWIAANNYNTIRNSVTIIGAFDKKYLYPEGTMKMANDYVNFFNEFTGWAKARDFTNKIDHKKASYSEKDENDITVEKGYKSTIMAVSFGDNPEAAIGKDGTLVEFEEAGKFPNLKESYMKTKPAMEDGIYTTGQMLIFGTGGDMESGTTDFAEMFYSPIPFKLLPFKNIWDENVSDTAKCGFFVPDYWCKPGFIDENGNSDNESAKTFEEHKREEILKESTGTNTLNEYIQQYPQSPEEAFLVTGVNDFPIVELRNQMNKIISEGLDYKQGQSVSIVIKDGKPTLRPDLKQKLSPIDRFPTKVTDKKGAVVIYEGPIENPPLGLYKAGYDPYRQDQSSGESLGAFYIYKSRNTFSYSGDAIVAEYVGRPNVSDTFNETVMYLAMIYNLELMHENEVTDVKSFFKNRKKLRYLASQPDGVISKNIKNSTVSRVYGIHMNEKLKDAGEKYIKRWLLEVRDVDENGNKVLNLEKIYSVALLQELISYSRGGNFDRVMALMMVMFQIEEDNNKEYGEKSRTSIVAQQLLNLKLYKR